MDRLLIACAILLMFVAAETVVYPHRSALRLQYNVPLDPQPPDGGGGGNNDNPPPDQPPGQTGYPTAVSTGPQTPPLKAYAGTELGPTAFRIDTPGVYDGFTFDRCVTIYANDVTISNSVINCRQPDYPAIWFRDGAANGRVIRNEINGIKVGNQSPGIGITCANGCVATQNRIVGPQDGIVLSGGSTAEDNYIGQSRGATTASGPSQHDAIVVTEGNATISHNTIDNICDSLLNQDDAQGCNAAVLTEATAGEVLIDRNYIKRWSWTVFNIKAGIATISTNYFGDIGLQCVIDGGTVGATSTQCRQ